RFGVAGIERERLVVGGERLVWSAETLERKREIEEIKRIARVARDRLADECDRDLMSARLLGDDAEEMQRVGIIGLGGERALKAPFRISQAACREVRQPLFQGARHLRGARVARSTLRRDAGTPLLAIHKTQPALCFYGSRKQLVFSQLRPQAVS